MREIDRHEVNRSRFVLEAVERELEHRRRQALLRSVAEPHELSEEIAEAGLGEWAAGSGQAEEELLDSSAGTAVRWSPEDGWIEDEA